MFIEHNSTSNQSGWIEVICGSMFSGKTEELIRRLRRAQIANQAVEIFKPAIDTRYSENEVVSHNQTTIPSTVVQSAQQILLLTGEVKVVGIDEAQFFDEEIVPVVTELANKGIRVIIAGLDMDYTANPFGPMPALLAKAEFITKVHAICQKCGALANHSYRKTLRPDQVFLGEKEAYEPRCRACFYESMSPRLPR
ncbi:MAG: thymidine kinase [Sphingobacteriia bacterium]|jgi:thymidine kinase|nr:thymidine kinase [Sphingobacteriia bacterium]